MTATPRHVPASRAVARNLRLLRARHRLTLEQLVAKFAAAGHPHMTYSMVSSIESRSHRAVTVDDLAAYHAVFGVTLPELIEACPTCGGVPPVGFTCNDCGVQGTGR